MISSCTDQSTVEFSLTHILWNRLPHAPANRGIPKGCRGAPTLEDRGVFAIAYGEAERAAHKNVASQTLTGVCSEW